MTLVIKTTGIEDYLDAGTANIKCLVMGKPGAGKTRSASYWPKPILADCEKGRMAVADRAMPYAAITSSEDMKALLKMLKLECNKPLQQRTYQTLVIDTLDSYQRIVIKERLDSEKKESLSGWQDWGYLDGKMTQLVASLQELSMNIVVNLHVKDTKVATGGGKEAASDDDDDKGSMLVVGPKLKGDLREQIAADFDLVGHMGTYYEAVDGERQMLRGIQWWPDPAHPILKDRSGQLPRWTPVTFTEEDHGNLFGHLISHLDNLQESRTLETLETNPAVTAEPVAPQAGGPVAAPQVPPTSTPATRAKAAKAAAPVPTEVTTAPAGPAAAGPPAAKPPAAAASPAAHQPGAAPTVVPTPVGVQAAPAAQADAGSPAETAGADVAPVATEPPVTTEPASAAAEAPVSVEAAVATAQAALGGEVISETPAAEVAPAEAVGAAPQEAGTEDGNGPYVCGTDAGLMEGEQPVQGCGKVIQTEGPEAEPNPMLVEIAQLKVRTNLCNACFTAHRSAQTA